MHKMQMINLENNPTTSSCPVMLGTLEESSPHLDCHPPLIQLPLHAAMDPKIILFRMVEFDSGLEIRNRKWLKIPVPMSFIVDQLNKLIELKFFGLYSGDEMIDWLISNVQGFRDRRHARSFASIIGARID
uniref:DEP domain-containing protein n=1 Tax=Meloidogyne incognita TaxID=6306 RepID=A0A914MEI6_MELIC